MHFLVKTFSFRFVLASELQKSFGNPIDGRVNCFCYCLQIPSLSHIKLLIEGENSISYANHTIPVKRKECLISFDPLFVFFPIFSYYVVDFFSKENIKEQHFSCQAEKNSSYRCGFYKKITSIKL